MPPTGGPNFIPDVERLEALLGACLEQGEARLEELVEKLCEAHSDRAAAIREEVEAARSAGLRRKPSEDADCVPPGGGTPFERIGPYQPLRELGRGGQGFVYLAEDTRLHRVVALKVLKGFGALSDKVIQRFRREAEVASRLDHPGICAVYDAGVAAGIPYIAMRMVEGQTLADSIKLARTSLTPEPGVAELIEFEDGAAPEPARLSASSPASTARKRSQILQIVGIVEKAARALHAAHEAGIIHRDIKPGNIMVTPAGDPVILDFGLASEEANELSLTQTGDLFGTPAYMSPEQLMAHRIRLDRRTDIYSLGVTLYECVTLQRPFDAATRDAMYRAIQYKDPSHARKLNREVPVDLDIVLEKALEKDCDRRYATALDFAEDLRRVRELEPIRARRVSAAGRLLRWARRRPVRAAVAAILVIGIPAVTALSGYSLAKAPEIRRGKELALLVEVERHLETGYAELAHGDPKVAVAAFDSALGLKPDSAEAIAGKAHALHVSGDYVACLRFLDEHRGLEGADFALTRTRYEVLTLLGRGPEAEEFAKHAPRDARTPIGWFVAGTIDMLGCDRQTDRQTFRTAAEKFTRAVLTAPHARLLFHSGLAHAAQHLGEAEPGRQSHEALLELWPDSHAAAYLAGCAVGGFDRTAAIDAYERAIALEPADAKPLHNLVHDLVGQGEPAEAVAACRRFTEANPDSAPGRYELGYALHAMGKRGEAVAAYRKSLELKADHWTYVMLGKTLREKGEIDEAMTSLRKAIELKPDLGTAHFHLALALKDKGDIDGAVAANRKAIELSPHVPETYVNLGHVLRDQSKSNIDEAMASFRKALELKPDLFEGHTGLGNAFLDEGRFDDALACFRNALELKPADALVHCNLGVALREKGQFDEAIAEHRKAIELDPNCVEAYAGLGDVFCDRKHEYDAGIAAYEKVIVLQPDHPRVFRNLAIALERKGDVDTTIAVSRRMIERKPDHPGSALHFSLGLALDQKRDFAASIEVWRKLIELRPKDAMARTNLGVTLVRTGDVEAGIAAFRKAIEMDSTYREAHRILGLMLRDKGDLDGAIAACEKVIELKPDVIDAYFGLGDVLLRRGRSDDAISCYRKAIELFPADGRGYYNLGNVLFQKDEFDEAEAAYKAAIQRNPNLAEAHCNLAQCYARDGRLLPTLESYRRGHDLGSGRPDWRYPSAEWLTQAEGAVLEEAGRLASAGLDANAEDRGKAAELLEPLLGGWRQDVDRRRRLDAVGAPLRLLVSEEPWVALRDPERTTKFPDAERKRWREVFSAVDELVRRTEGGK